MNVVVYDLSRVKIIQFVYVYLAIYAIFIEYLS